MYIYIYNIYIYNKTIYTYYEKGVITQIKVCVFPESV